MTGFIAKENVVGTLAVCFVGLENLIDTDELALMEGAGTEVASVFAITKVAALAYLVYQIGTLVTTGHVGAGLLPGLTAVLIMILVILLLIRRTDRELMGTKEAPLCRT